MLWKCCKNIVDVAFFFNSSPDFSNHYFILFFFLPFSAMPLPQLLKKKFILLFRQWHCHNSFVKFYFFYFFLFTSGTPRTGNRTGQRKFGISVAEIQHFLSPPFSSSLSYFWLNFGNSNTEIQSLSSKSQITLNYL